MKPEGWWCWLQITSSPVNQENIHEPITPCSLNSIRLLKQSASDQVTGGVLPLVGWVLLAPLLKCSAKRHHVYAAFVWLFLLFKNNFCFSLQLLNLYAWNFKLLPYYIPKNWCFWTVVLEKTLESPLDSKEIQPVHPKGNQSWLYIGRTDAEAETTILWPPDAKSWLIWKDPDAGKDWRQEEKGTTEDGMLGWHY